MMSEECGNFFTCEKNFRYGVWFTNISRMNHLDLELPYLFEFLGAHDPMRIDYQ